MEDKPASSLQELFEKRPWIKTKFDNNKDLFDAFEILKDKKNYESILIVIEYNDLQDWMVEKTLYFYKENRLYYLNLFER
jgi:hypothetical protein